MKGLARGVVAQLSPAHRRWRRLLQSLPLDPDALPVPLPAPGPRDFMICGSPRTGTALLTAALYQPPGVVTVMEPWDAFRLPPADLFRSVRDEIASTGMLSRGRLDVAALQDSGRVTWTRDGERPCAVAVAEGYLLGIKLPAFWRYLPLLPETKFLVCVRDPAETIASYRGAGGRLALGLEYDVPFHARMNEMLEAATTDVRQRQVMLYDHVNRHIVEQLGRPNVFEVRYERWFSDPEALLREIGEFLGADVSRPLSQVRPRQATSVASVASATAAALGYAP